MQIAPAMTGPGQARTSSLMSGHSGAGAGSAAQIEGHCHGSGAGHAQWTAGQSVGPLARWFAKWMPVRTSSCTIHRAAARRWSMHSEHSAAEGGWSRCDKRAAPAQLWTKTATEKSKSSSFNVHVPTPAI